ncbi:hypothetical protein EDB85DRAFT_2137322 [Lactarius pseudohatsudake]|nr:hypothetical protein EDB85DRAFT_2137322 [Lactarius pseudohatsudake]
MGKSATKVVYKPDPNASDVFLVLVNPVEYKKWKGGDRYIPLDPGSFHVEVDKNTPSGPSLWFRWSIVSFEIFSSNQGPQGLLCRPSKQQLDTVFNTHVDDDVIQQILEKGKVEASENLASEKSGQQE